MEDETHQPRDVFEIGNTDKEEHARRVLRSSSSFLGSNGVIVLIIMIIMIIMNNNNNANDSNGISPSSRTNSPSSSSIGGNGRVEVTNGASNVLFLQRLSTKVAALSASIAIAVASAPGAHFASFLNPWNSVSHSSSLVAYAEEQDTASSGKSDNGSTDTIAVDNEKELSPDALVVDEVWQLVSDTFLPVRNDISVGFDREGHGAALRGRRRAEKSTGIKTRGIRIYTRDAFDVERSVYEVCRA